MFNKKRKARRGTQKAAGNDKEIIIVNQLYTDSSQMSINFENCRCKYKHTIEELKDNRRLRKKHPAILPLLNLGLSTLDLLTPEYILHDIDNHGLYCCPRCYKYIEATSTKCWHCGANLIPKGKRINDFKINIPRRPSLFTFKPIEREEK